MSPAQAASRNAAPRQGQRDRLVEQSLDTVARRLTHRPAPPHPARRPVGGPARRAQTAARARGARRDPQDGGRLVRAQPGEVAEHGDLGQVRLLRLELLDRLVHGEEVVSRRLDDRQALGQVDAVAAAAVLAPLTPGLLDEDVPHRPRRGAEEVAAAVPAGVPIAHQAEVGLVDQGGRLEGLAGRQPAGQRGGQSPQLRVDDRQQFRRGLHSRLGPDVSLVGHGTTSRSPGEENRKS